MDKSIGKKIRRLYLHEIAFKSSGKKHDFKMFMPSYRMRCTIMVHFIGLQL